MQNRKSSESLSATIASATFQATHIGATHSYEDILLLELISNQSTLCYQLLSGYLSAPQIEQLKSRMSRILSAPHTPTDLSLAGMTPERYYRDLVEVIASRYPDVERVSTLHALHFIVSDTTTIASRSLAMLGMTLPALERAIREYSIQNGLQPLRVALTPPKRERKIHPLSKFGTDLVALAQQGEIDPVIGRDAETERLIEILSRRKKNNPILVGEAGVGKSAIVEGLALRIASGSVPHNIANKHLFSLDISALVAGTKFRGEFEERMQQLLTAISASRDSIIFIDEIHTIVGAGATQGSLDTANILKPTLARGEIQTIGATTLDEYRTHIEPDSALERRFQRIVVDPTSIEQSIEILRQVAQHYESHHNVIYSDEALVACVKLSHRYLPDRQLPDKAIDLMDEAGAHASISTPADGKVMIVKRCDIERIITTSTGIPTEQISQGEMTRLQHLNSHLNSNVIGQEEAVESISKSILRSRSGLSDEHRPIGVFMLVGPTGVGKTHLAKELAKWMFGDESRNLIRIDMSEYGQSHNVSRLIGSPPGYVGYGEGGELSEAVRHNPYSVVLLDEIEKAHPDIFNVMLQIFDEGRLTDGAGREIDFRQSIIIMTSNIGSHTLLDRLPPVGFVNSSKSEQLQRAPKEHYRKALEAHFSPEFLNRIDETIIFDSLTDSDIERIVERELEHIFERVRSLGFDIRTTPSARRELATLGYRPKYGARVIKRTLRQWVEDPLSQLIIAGEVERGDSITIERNRSGEGVKIKIAQRQKKLA